MEIFLDVSGYRNCVGKFIVTEIGGARSVMENNVKVVETFGQRFHPPVCCAKDLSVHLQSECHHDSHYFNCWREIHVPYDELDNIFDSALDNRNYIYVYGTEKQELIEEIFKPKVSVMDLEGFGCPNLGEIAENIEDTRLRQGIENGCPIGNAFLLWFWSVHLDNLEISVTKSIRMMLQLHDLSKLTTIDISQLPVEYIMQICSKDIDHAWPKLPNEMQQNPMIMGYQRCLSHFGSTICEIDGPAPMKKDCNMCKLLQGIRSREFRQ